MFVQGEWSFHTIRVLLGVAEAGLFPALMYMVTLWFASKDLSVAVGWIYSAPALALVIGNPRGAAFMQMDGFAGLHGWQWLSARRAADYRGRCGAGVQVTGTGRQCTRLGGLDVLINNLGIAGPTGPVEDFSPEQWDRTISTNPNSQYCSCTKPYRS